MLFDKKVKPGEYIIEKEGANTILKINYDGYPFVPSVEDSDSTMAKVVDILVESPGVNTIIFTQRRNYVYNYEQTNILNEIAGLYNYLTKQKKILSLSFFDQTESFQFYSDGWREALNFIVHNLLKSDPIGAYVELKRVVREERIKIRKTESLEEVHARSAYIETINYLIKLLDGTTLISGIRNSLAGHIVGSRGIYRTVFKPEIGPDFVFTRLMADIPLHAEEIDAYSLDSGTDVTIYRIPNDIKYYYHLSPPEFKISEEKYVLLDLARNSMLEYKPKKEEFTDPEKMRRTFFNIGKDMIGELAEHRGYDLSYADIEELAHILVRYTVGFGFVELLLKDKNIQDINVNGPIGETPLFIVHAEFDECTTNIIPAREDGESWATKFRIISGRPLDEANPVLDTELILPYARARVAAMGRPLNPTGLAFAFRRHRDNPWTYPLFISNRMMGPYAAGLLNFLVDGGRSMLFAGTRGSGKTSLLGSTLVELMRKHRIITVEDSVTGDSSILIKEGKRTKRTTIGKLIDSLIEKYGCWYNLSGCEILGNDDSIKILSMDKKGKIAFKNVSKFIRHKTTKPIYKIITRTGREINVTGDHSLFGLEDNAHIGEIKVDSLKKGDFIAAAGKFSFNNKESDYINLLDYLDKLEKGYFEGQGVKELFDKYSYEIKQLGIEYGHNRSLRALWKRKGVIPIKIIKDLVSFGHDISVLKNSYFKANKNSGNIPVMIELDVDMLAFVGLWIADGCYDKNSVILSVVEEENRAVAYNLSKKYGFNVKMHSDTFSLMLNSSTLKKIMRDVLDLKGNAYTKIIPGWVFNLSDAQISYVLRGLFSGDGSVTDKGINMSLSSLNLLRDVQTLLLGYGIIFRIGNLGKDKTYSANISALKYWKTFNEKIGFLPNYKKDKLTSICSKISTHDITNVIPFSLETKKKFKNIFSKFNSYDYVNRNNNIGREKLGSLLVSTKNNDELIENLRNLSVSNVFWDQIRSIEVITDFHDYVYDLSVPDNESFVCNNIVAHNTQEIPVDYLRKIGYNIQSMKVRSALTKGGSEVGADEGIRTSLRFGDSSLIVGEIRSIESKALYEAMRVGALANLVAGTIHGASPYAVYDRVVNDLEVPKTSFKATDIIVISNPVKTSGGLHKQRRVLQITEVRKHWEDDPLRENGFVDLMKYDVKEDLLKPTEALLQGDSDILKSIASQVKEFVGNWDAVLENIQLRANIKRTLVETANKTGNYQLLEADFVVRSNDSFHQLMDNTREETGNLDSKRIFFEWNNWLKKEVKNFKT